MRFSRNFTFNDNQVCDINGIIGFSNKIETNRGRRINVWFPHPNNNINNKYFCHGLAFNTFVNFGCSVFSGRDLKCLLEDEWHTIFNLMNARSTDIVIWENYRKFPENYTEYPCHSAILDVVYFNQQLNNFDYDRTILISKNGIRCAPGRYSLRDLCNIYGSQFTIYRHQ